MTKSLMLLLALVAFSVPAAADDAKVCGAPAALADGWTTAAQADLGLDPARLCALDSFIAQWPQANIHAVVVVHKRQARDGALLQRRRRALGQPARHRAVRGRRQARPAIDLQERDLASGRHRPRRGQVPGPRLLRHRLLSLSMPACKTADNARITFADFLTMSSGLAWDESLPYSNPANSERRLIDAADPIKYVLQAAPRGAARRDLQLQWRRHDGTGRRHRQGDRTASRRLRARQALRAARHHRFRMGQAALAAGSARRPLRGCACGRAIRPSSGSFCWATVRGTASRSCPRAGPRSRSSRASTARASISTAINGGSAAPSATAPSSPGRQASAMAASGSTSCPTLDLVVMVNAGHYGGPLQGVIPLGIFTRVVLPAVKD